MEPDPQPMPEHTPLPDFRVAGPSEWLGDPDVDAVATVLSMPQYADLIMWSPQGAAPEDISSSDQLVARVGALDDNRFGVVQRRYGSLIRFGQTLRVGDVWIVEVHDGTEDD